MGADTSRPHVVENWEGGAIPGSGIGTGVAVGCAALVAGAGAVVTVVGLASPGAGVEPAPTPGWAIVVVVRDGGPACANALPALLGVRAAVSGDDDPSAPAQAAATRAARDKPRTA